MRLFNYDEGALYIFIKRVDMIRPIWNNEPIVLGSHSQRACKFRVLVGSEVIYEGKAYNRRYPSGNSMRVNINDICSDWLQSVLPTLSQAEFSALTLPVTFTLQQQSILITQEWETKEEIQYLANWSYDKDFNPRTMSWSHPIARRVDNNQWLFATIFEQEEVEVKLFMPLGVVNIVTIPISRTNDFNGDYSADFSRSISSAGSGTAVLDLSEFQGVEAVEMNGIRYDVVKGCHEYALHYLNKYGGWDSLLIEGATATTESISRKTRKIDYVNTDPSVRGEKNYLNEITEGWILNTGWLMGDSASRLTHLLTSGDVYLERLADKQIFAVVITNTTNEVKSFKDNGRQPINVTIECKLAQRREVRR